MISKSFLTMLAGAACGAALAHFWGHCEWQSAPTGYMAIIGAFIAVITAR